MMVLFTTLLSPLHAYVRNKSGTVLAPAILHGLQLVVEQPDGGIVYFLTDGELGKEADKITDWMARQDLSRIVLNTIGIGARNQDLAKLADLGGGMHGTL